MLNTLNALLREYLLKEIDYRAYRRECCKYVDGPEDRLWLRQESACSAFEHEILGSELDLRRELLDILTVYYQPPLQQFSYTSNCPNIATVLVSERA